jgi:fatty acid desaturase
MAASDRCIVMVEGEQYDLTDFVHTHPGGPSVLLFSKGRDATIAVNTGHKDPARTVYPILRKYKVETPQPAEEVMKKTLGIPGFLLPESFSAVEDIPTYNFDHTDGSLLVNKVRKLILAEHVQQRIQQLDRLFDMVVIFLLVSYFCFLGLWLTGDVPWFVAVPAFAILRTGLAGGGHYYLHRAGKALGDVLFDINYVGTALTGIDGHCLLHHMYTQSEADVKRGFFGGMMGVPRLLRIPVHTLHKLGHTTTGMLVKGYQVEIDEEVSDCQGVYSKLRKLNKASVNWKFWTMQILLRVELVLAVYQGLFWSWFSQFVLSLWMNTLLVVSSHDFEEVVAKESKDWAEYQLLNAHDMSITGNPWVDCFLSAGLAPHRAHHIFPYQRSGFANHFSNKFLALACKDKGLPWHPAKNLFTEILPDVISRQLLLPVRHPVSRRTIHGSFLSEHLSPSAWLYSVKYAILGFKGIGSL